MQAATAPFQSDMDFSSSVGREVFMIRIKREAEQVPVWLWVTLGLTALLMLIFFIVILATPAGHSSYHDHIHAVAFWNPRTSEGVLRMTPHTPAGRYVLQIEGAPDVVMQYGGTRMQNFTFTMPPLQSSPSARSPKVQKSPNAASSHQYEGLARDAVLGLPNGQHAYMLIHDASAVDALCPDPPDPVAPAPTP